jgi:hypothetical protein
MRTEKTGGADRPRRLRAVSTSTSGDLAGLEPERRALNDPLGRAPVIVGVDGSARSIDALVLADVLAAALRTRLVIAHVHSLGKLSSVFSEDEHELIVRGVAESTFEQIRDYLPSVPERRLQLISEKSPAAGLHALAEREQAWAVPSTARRSPTERSRGRPSSPERPLRGSAWSPFTSTPCPRPSL